MAGKGDSVELPTDVASPTPRESRWLIALVFAGIALRILVIVFRAGELSTDPDAYVAHAETLRETGGFNVPGTETPTAFRPPFYPLLLAALRATGIKVTFAVGLINVLAGALVIIATWWMARVIGLRGHWAGATAAAVGIDPILLRYTVLPMTEVLAAAMLSLAVLQVLKARSFLTSPMIEGHDVRHAHSPTKSAIVAGVCFGLSGLCRPVALITCAVLTLVQVFLLCWQSFGSRKSEAASSTALTGRVVILPALVAGLILLPWIIRNATHFNAFVPATTHGGYTLLLGNNDVFYDEVVLPAGNPVWDGKSLDRWQQQLQRELTEDGAAQGNEVAVDEWMYDRAVRTVKARPGVFVQACVLRWRRFWALTPAMDSYDAASVWLSVPVAVWYTVLWAGLPGSILFCVVNSRFVRCFRRTVVTDKSCPSSVLFRSVADIQLLWVSVLSFLVLHSFYWTNARMRGPVMGILCVLAVTGWRYWYSLWIRRRSGKRPA